MPGTSDWMQVVGVVVYSERVGGQGRGIVDLRPLVL